MVASRRLRYAGLAGQFEQLGRGVTRVIGNGTLVRRRSALTPKRTQGSLSSTR
jgi:hypothetical protein